LSAAERVREVYERCAPSYDLGQWLPERLLIARLRRRLLSLTVDTMDAERLAFPDRSFDTVVSTLTLCTTLEPVRLLQEMGRVCRSGGRILLLEHGLGTAPAVNWILHRLARGHLTRCACHLARDVAVLPVRAGLRVLDQKRHLWGVVTVTEATP
jgi:ubiquinone/menaquinone biosynthesis C-methylase UbiE